MEALIRRWTLHDRASRAVPALDTTECSGDAECQPDPSSNQNRHTPVNGDDRQKHEFAATGAEWVWVEEPVGFFFPEMQKRKCLLELDQVRHVLHYDRYRRVMRIHDISLVTSVEEVSGDGQRAWWMTIQDPRALQVWVLHFASLERLQHWVALLRAVVCATDASALVSDVVLASTLDRRPSLAIATAAAAAAAVSSRKQLEDASVHCRPESLDPPEQAVMIAVS